MSVLNVPFPTGYQCITPVNVGYSGLQSIYAYRGYRSQSGTTRYYANRDTYTLNGLTWQRTSAETYTGSTSSGYSVSTYTDCLNSGVNYKPEIEVYFNFLSIFSAIFIFGLALWLFFYKWFRRVK